MSELLLFDHMAINLAPSRRIKSVTLPLFSDRRLRKWGKPEGICSGQFLTPVKITPRVLPSQRRPKRPITFRKQAWQVSKLNIGPKRKPRTLPEPTSIRCHLPGSSTHSELRSSPKTPIIIAKTISGVTPTSDMKTLRNLPHLRWLQLGCTPRDSRILLCC